MYKAIKAEREPHVKLIKAAINYREKAKKDKKKTAAPKSEL